MSRQEKGKKRERALSRRKGDGKERRRPSERSTVPQTRYSAEVFSEARDCEKGLKVQVMTLDGTREG